MSEQITNMKVRFGADTKQFKKGMDDGKKAVQTFKNDAGSAMESFANQFGVSLGPLAGILNKATTATKGLSAGMKSAAAGTNIFTGALKLLKTALIATGIGALVVALGSLISYFTRTQRGADKMKTAISGLKAAFNVIIDRLSVFGEGLYTMFVKREWKDGFTILKSSFKGVTEEIREEARAATELEKANQRLRDREISLIEVQAKRRKEIAAARLLAEDETIAAKDRLTALQRAQELEKKTLEENKAVQQERIRIMEEEIALGESTADEYRELAQAKAQLQDIEASSLKMQKRLQTEVNSLTNEINAETEAIIKQRAEMAGLMGGEIQSKDVDLGANVNFATPQLEVEKLTTGLKTNLGKSKDVIIEFADTFNSAFSGIAENFGTNLGLMLAGADGVSSFSDIVKASFGDMAVSAGKIITKAGIAFFAIGEAFRQALKTPAAALAAIAAGTALIAVGTATKASLSSVASGGSGTFSSNTGKNYSDFTPSNNSGSGTRAQAQPIKVEVAGEFRLYGRDLVSSINEVNKRDQY